MRSRRSLRAVSTRACDPTLTAGHLAGKPPVTAPLRNTLAGLHESSPHAVPAASSNAAVTFGTDRHSRGGFTAGGDGGPADPPVRGPSGENCSKRGSFAGGSGEAVRGQPRDRPGRQDGAGRGRARAGPCGGVRRGERRGRLPGRHPGPQRAGPPGDRGSRGDHRQGRPDSPGQGRADPPGRCRGEGRSPTARRARRWYHRRGVAAPSARGRSGGRPAEGTPDSLLGAHVLEAHADRRRVLPAVDDLVDVPRLLDVRPRRRPIPRPIVPPSACTR